MTTVETSAKTIGWRRMTILLTAAMVGWAITLSVIAGELIPPIAVFGLLFALGGWLTWRRPGKAGPITLAVVATLMLLTSAPFTFDALPHPDSPADFLIGGVAALVLPIALIIAAVAALRHWDEGPATVVRNLLLGVLVTSVAISAFAAVSVDDDVMAEGDVLVVAERAEFDPTELAVSSTSGVFIDNRDPVRHTFTVDALDVSVELPAGSARRIELDAPPGAYRFVCSVAGHESMTGTLVVNG